MPAPVPKQLSKTIAELSACIVPKFSTRARNVEYGSDLGVAGMSRYAVHVVLTLVASLKSPAQTDSDDRPRQTGDACQNTVYREWGGFLKEKASGRGGAAAKRDRSGDDLHASGQTVFSGRHGWWELTCRTDCVHV